MISGVDVRQNEKNLAVFSDEDCLSERKSSVFGDEPVGRGSRARWITEDWIIQLELLRELLVEFRCVTTGCEIGHVEFADGIAARTERLTFACSATSEGFGEPRHDYSFFTFEVGQFVGLSVTARQLKVRSRVADFQSLGGHVAGHEKQQRETACEPSRCVQRH